MDTAEFRRSASPSAWTLSAVAGSSAMLCCGGFIVFATIQLVVRCWIPAPTEDQWQELVSGRTISWDWLMSQHNEHRILLPRLVFLVDRWLFREQNVFDLFVNILIQFSISGILVVDSAKEMRGSRAETVFIAGFVLSMLFWSVQWENFVWGFQVQFFGVTLGALVVFRLVASARPSVSGLAASLVAMACTTFTLASGFVAAFIAVPLAWLVGRPRRDVAVVAVAAVALLAFYLHGYRPTMREADDIAFATRSLQFVAHVVADLGGPVGNGLAAVFGWDALTAAWCAGSLGLAAFAASTWSSLRHDRSPATMTFVALGGFVVAAVCVTAHGRAVFGPQQALSSRYASPVLVFWVVQWLLLALATKNWRGWRLLPVWGVAMAMAVLAVASQQSFADVAAWTVEARFEGLPALAARVMDVPRLKPFQSDPREILGYLDRLEAAGTSFYADDWLRWMGDDLGRHAGSVDPSRCSGEVASVERLETPPHPGWRLSGSVDAENISGRIRLVITDEAGRVVGFGIVPPLAAREATGGPAPWVGYIAGAAPRVIVPHLLLHDHVACSLPPSRALYMPDAGLAPTPAE